MFHWICPECGREIAPTVRECPVCDSGAEQEELVLAGVVEASARTLELDASGNGAKDRADPAARHPGAEAVEHAASPFIPEPVKWYRRADNRAAMDRSSGAVQDTHTPVPVLGRIDDTLPKSSFEPSTADASALTPEILDAQSALARAAEAKIASMREVVTRAAEGWVHQAPATEARPIAPRTVESRAVESRSIETKSIEPKSVESKSIEAKSLETKPIETRPVETKVVSTTAVATTPVQATPVDRIPLLAKLSRLALPKIAPALSKSEFGKTRTIATDLAHGAAEIESVPAREAVLPSTPTAKPEITPAIEVPVAVQAITIAPTGPDSKAVSNLEATPQEPSPQELTLPSFAATDCTSLNALLAAVSMLDDGNAAQLGEPLVQHDPPSAEKLPLPMSAANLTPVAPALVSIGSVEPRATPPANHGNATVDEVRVPAAAGEHEIAGLALADCPLPLQRPSARNLKSALAGELNSLKPCAGAVRAPRSPAPFPSPNDAGLVKYDPLEKHPIQPAAPTSELRKSATAPRITLPGPMLTRSLVAFTGRELTPVFLEARAFRKGFRYGWIAIVLAVGTVLGVGFSNMVSPPGRPPVEARAASDAPSATETVHASSGSPEASPSEAAVPSPAPVQATGSNALSKNIEVTGFRIVMDPSRKPQVQYLVVNHSSARFPDATIYITLRAANAHVGQAPLCRFSFAAPDLGPYEAKEMISAIEKTNRPVNLPEWQDLRAEVEIGR